MSDSEITGEQQRLLAHLTICQTLILAILNYESDTFNARAQRVSSAEAERMALRLLRQLRQIVSEGGTVSCDGTVLSALLDEVREEARTISQRSGA